MVGMQRRVRSERHAGSVSAPRAQPKNERASASNASVRAILLAALMIGGCASAARSPSLVVDPNAAPEEPAAACVVFQKSAGENAEYRYDGNGRLLFMIDQPEYGATRRSWFFYEKGWRVTRVHRRVERIRRPSLIDPGCDQRPCATAYADHDRIDELYSYDAQGRIVREVEFQTTYERDDVNKGLRPFYGNTRTTTILYAPVLENSRTQAVTIERISEERSNFRGNGPWHFRAGQEDRSDYEREARPHGVIVYRTDGGRKVEIESSNGPTLREIHFLEGHLTRVVTHSYNAAGLRTQTIQKDDAEEQTGTYTYDAVGRLLSIRFTRDLDDWENAWTYEYTSGCTPILHHVWNDPRGLVVPVDPLAPMRL
jgi:YD repeat-containing protein